MADVGATYLNIADINKQTYPDGSPVQMIIDMMLQTNQVIEDIPMLPCNMGHVNKTTVRTAIPAPTWVGIYDYVGPSKSAYAEYEDTCGMMEARAEVAERLLRLNPKSAAKVLSNENAGFIEGMAQEWVEYLFYGDVRTNPKAFTGLAPRFASKTTGYYNQVIDAGGTGSDNTSVWFNTWGEPFCHGIFPEGTVGGIEDRDLGIVQKFDANGGSISVALHEYMMKCGLAIKDPRSVVRICNIDVSDLDTAGSGSDTSANLIRYMTQAYHKLINPAIRLPVGQTRIYCNAEVMIALDRQAQAAVKAGAGITYENYQGMMIPHFRGIPIKRVDRIRNNETRVT